MRRTVTARVGAAVAVVLAAAALAAVPDLASAGIATVTTPGDPTGAATTGAATPAPVLSSSQRRVESAARASIAKVSPQFATTTSGSRSLQLAAVVPVGGGDDVARFQQFADGVPVYGGQLAVQVAADDKVLSVTGATSSDVGALVRTVAPAAAQSTALRVARGRSEARGVALTAGPATAYVYDPLLIGEPDTGVRPVWQVVVSGPPASGVAVEVLVDASSGGVAQVIDRTERLNRTICDNRDSTTSNLAAGSWCTPKDFNGYFLTTIDASHPDALYAFQDLGDVAAFYSDVLHVDLTQQIGLDTSRPYSERSTPALTATVNYCETDETCPYANAFWIDANPAFVPAAGRTYPGGQVYLGRGLPYSEDVVAHEVTHGVTASVNGLLYQNQSGSINESMSDVFGELTQLYDHTTHSFVDSRDRRWLIGERLNVPGLRGAVRSMSNPSTTSLVSGEPQPNRMTSKYWVSGSADNGGVHANNGVGNKTAYLIARGGTFDGYKIRGIGEWGTARIYWRAQNLLTPGASYRDLAITLALACDALYKTSSHVCASVRAATAATQIAKSRIALSMSSSTVKYGRARTIHARMTTFRGGSVYVRASEHVRFVLERRYPNSKKWTRVSTRSATRSGHASWTLHPKRSAVYRVRYLGSTSLGLRGSSAKRTIHVRR